MRLDRFEIVLGAALAALFAALWFWQAPGAGAKLAPAEVESYLGRIEGHLPVEPAEEAEFLARLRAWGLADDGRPVYMLNAMRYFAELRRVRGSEAIRATPAEANAFYEKAVAPRLLALGAYPVFGGETTGLGPRDPRQSNLSGFDPTIDGWNRVLVVRYPSRRAFLELLSDPVWQKFAPYKFAALDLALVPVGAEALVPDPRWIVGGLCLAVFLGAGWWRAARTRTRTLHADPPAAKDCRDDAQPTAP